MPSQTLQPTPRPSKAPWPGCSTSPHAPARPRIGCKKRRHRAVSARDNGRTQDPWGNLLAVADSVPGGWMYRYVGAYGCRLDADTGLVYMRQRWYAPDLQRFIGRDQKRSANRYAYGANSPTNYIDPSGRDWWNPFTWSRGKLERVRALGDFALGLAQMAVGSGEDFFGGGGAVATAGASAPVSAAMIVQGTGLILSGGVMMTSGWNRFWNAPDEGGGGGSGSGDAGGTPGKQFDCQNDPNSPFWKLKVKFLNRRLPYHPTNEMQRGPVQQMSTEDLFRYRPEDPISGEPFFTEFDPPGQPGTGFAVAGGHHRLEEIVQRYMAGEISGEEEIAILKKQYPGWW